VLTKSASTVDATKAALARLRAEHPALHPGGAGPRQGQHPQLVPLPLRHQGKGARERERLEFYGYPADYLETYKAALEKVTLADLTAVAKKYIHPDKLAVLVVGNGPEIKPGLDELKLGPRSRSTSRFRCRGNDAGLRRTRVPDRLWARHTPFYEFQINRREREFGGASRGCRHCGAEDAGTGTAFSARNQPGLVCIPHRTLLAHLGKLTTDNPHGELYLTDMAKVLHSAGERVIALKTSEPDRLLGANTIAELVALDATLRTATANRLMAAGVTIFRPETCVIDAEVEVAADTIIEPFVQLLGSTRIGTDCRIRSYTVIENCTLGDSVLIRQSCVLADSTIGNGAQIGPFARIRPGCEIGEGVHIGNFVETKKAKLGKGVKAGHLSYLGDAEIGEETNIGAGVITCNYDGVRKHTTQIGKGVFVGSDSTLVAPVSVEDGAYIGAGSCITKTVPAGSLAVARSHQITKKGWAEARRARDGEQK
jgi:acetyltransferase-like isoleucine patch superfamily enzyme